MTRCLLYIILIFSSSALFAQNKVGVKQENGIKSLTTIMQIGNMNKISGLLYTTESARQYSQGNGINKIDIVQVNDMYGTNNIFLYQSASENNIAHFTQQNGINTIILNETSTAGSNETHISQLNGINFANIERNAYLNNTIPSSANTKMLNPLSYDGIYQEGLGNFITGAGEISLPFIGPKAIIRLDLPAKQISHTGNNWMEVWQTGNFNSVGLYQEAFSDNTALINQSNDWNIAVAFQKSAGGTNHLFIEQTGGMTAHIYQVSQSGANTAVVKQH